MNSQFQQCLASGESYEHLFADIIQQRLVGSVATKMRGNFKEFDFRIDYRDKNNNPQIMLVEVKADRRAAETGNIVIEYEGYGKPSGISTTTAGRWAYFIEGTNIMYFIPVQWIRDAIANGLYNYDICGGHLKASRMYIFSLKDIPEKFRTTY